MNRRPRVPSHHRGGTMPRPWRLLASCAIAGSVLLCAPQVVVAQANERIEEANEPIEEATGASSETPASYSHDPMAPRAQAVRTAQPIVIDGLLDERVWMTAPAITEFLQTIPDEGQPVSEETEVRLLYDDDYIYVGAWLWDEGEVLSRLARRDAVVPDADFFAIMFDSYHDHRTAYRFGAFPSAVQKDIIMVGGRRGDDSWDPIWDLETTITDQGWFLEMRIPFSQLRYRADEVQHWGFQVERKIRRRGEDTAWAFTPRSEPSGVARYGHLDGVEGIAQGKRLELLPYVTGRAEYLQIARSEGAGFDNPFRSGSDFFGNAGLDLKYRLGTNLTLDATVNPDFGQVELDPAVINLTAFETRFEEKRPFFVEGAEIFRFGDLGGRPGGSEVQLLYSRRIGRTPQGPLPGGAAYVDVPGSTTILGAMKLSGKTASGWSMGFLDAVTDRVRVPWADVDNVRGETKVEPLANYMAARLRRDMRQGTASFGVIATSVNRALGTEALEARLRSSAYSIGADSRIEWNSQKWMLAGKLSGSRVNGSVDAIARTQESSARYLDRPDATHLRFDPLATSLTGFYGKLDLVKQAGSWQGDLGVTGISPGYEVNDLGFQSWADRIDVRSNFGYQQPTAGRYFRTLSATAGTTGIFNFGGEAVAAEASLSLRAQHVSFNGFNAHIARQFGVWNDRLTRGGPLTRQPAGYSGRIGFNTDRRRVWQLQAGLELMDDDEGGWGRGGDLTLGVRFLESYELQVGTNVSRTRTAAQYITTVADPAATNTFGHRYVFAPLDQTTIGVETRLNITFTPKLTFELYAQPFVSSGDYLGLMELAAPRTFDFIRYGQDIGTVTGSNDGGFTVDPDGTGSNIFQVDALDFNFRSLLGNAVLRWEWRSGSTLFLVWQQTRSQQLVHTGGGSLEDDVGEFKLGRDTRALFGLKPDNVFMLKVTYWMNP